jgi:hypothetical protein
MTGANTAAALGASGRPGWLSDADELPHVPPGVPLWCENYLSYVYAPTAGIGIYLHMCHRGGHPDLWDEKFVVSLPDDRFLLAKSFSPGYPDRGPVTAALSLRCEEPFRVWTQCFRGAARLLEGGELRSAPVSDGVHVPVQLELQCHAFSPAYDFGGEKLDQSWGTGHYEQHHRAAGELRVGEEVFAVEGTGLRDHSWGPRDYRQIGSTVWAHGQFPNSGRSFMAVLVSGRPPRPPFTYSVISDGGSVVPVSARGIEARTRRAQADEDYTFELVGPDGTSTIRARIERSIDMAFVGPTEIALGTHRGPEVNHAYVESFTRFEWDGEVGYGATDVSIET